jgi:hypothetical protein
MKITRAIVTDLWPLCVSGEASPDSRALVDEFLAQDQEFAAQLREEDSASALEPVAVTLPPSLEARSLTRTRKALQGRSRVRLLAAAFTGLAIMRAIEDAPWNVVSPQRCILTALVAVVLWAICFVIDWRKRSAVG